MMQGIPLFNAGQPLRRRDIVAMALTIAGEARGEELAGRIAVAWVIRNRAEDPGKDWWGDTVEEVCRKPWQFTCWADADPNSGYLQELEQRGTDDPVYRAAYEIALEVLMGSVADPTKGATHYHVAGLSPAWSRGHRPSATIGRHVFYRLGSDGKDLPRAAEA